MDGRRRHFERLYERSDDPWNYAGSPYEHAKYASTLNALGDRRYSNGLEVGCSVGVLSAMLAERCESLLATDLNPKAARLARARLDHYGACQVLVAEIPAQWPRGRYDLVMLSEVLYYLAAAEIRQLVPRVVRDLEPGGDCVLVNWLGETDTELCGRAASALFRDTLATQTACEEIHASGTDRYELRVLRRGRC